ncbi:MAG: MBL fold metallo-hydrolase [Clostridiales bacterium]|nr:MBL fold metallo-hydrolase [Clostridiales bacterium]
MSEYFTSEKLTEHVTRIRDILGVGLYLVEGQDRACVIDTGHGLGNLRDYIETLTDKPVFVILTHGHVDHAGGAALWEETWMSPLDEEVYREHSRLAFRREHFIHDEKTKDIPVEEYVPPRTEDFYALSDGKTFDLGGLTLECIAAPGHTPGMTMVLIREERMILFGDGCGLEVLLCFTSSSTVSEYYTTLEKIRQFEPYYDRIIRNHGTCESPKELLGNVIACCEDILAGTDAAQKTSFHGQAALSAREIDEKHQRVDGKEGNILYTEDKRC